MTLSRSLIRGTQNNDIIDISARNGYWDIHGLGGNDTLDVRLGQGFNVLNGGIGKDLLTGNRSDSLHGGIDDDILDVSHGQGRNMLNGGVGDDRLFGRSHDTLEGGVGNDRLVSVGGERSLLRGGVGADRLWSMSQKDELHGGAGDDRIYLEGARSDYQFHVRNGISVLTNRSDISEGTHHARGIEIFIFADGTHTNALGATITPTATSDGVVADWVRTALNLIAQNALNPLVATRVLALNSNAVWDTVEGISHAVSKDAAAVAASHTILTTLFPEQTDALNQKLVTSLARIEQGQAKIAGVALGIQTARQVLAERAADGWDAIKPWIVQSDAGHWQPTPAGFKPALAPHWGDVKPWVLEDGDQFRPDGPTPLTSAEYAKEFNEVKTLGERNSTVRSAEQTEIAKFWADGGGTYTPPGHWNEITANLLTLEGASTQEAAYVFAMLSTGLFDAGIAAWDAKYAYDFWRPVTAIHRAAEDGNPLTVADAGWTPLIATPPFPEYVSGHSTFSATAATILTQLFGSVPFTSSSMGLQGVHRTFDDFYDAAQEAGMSRIYGGIHFQSGNLEGQEIGVQVGQAVFEDFWSL